jgi:hypothetical protein
MSLIVPKFEQPGLCSKVDPDTFFPEVGRNVREAKRICQDCPVRIDCLTWALDHSERYGVWGGKTYEERKHIKMGRVELVEVEVPPLDMSKYTCADGHGYRGYKRGCKCHTCKSGYAMYQREYQLRAGRRDIKRCTVCDNTVSGFGRTLYCGPKCKATAKARRRAAARSEARELVSA